MPKKDLNGAEEIITIELEKEFEIIGIINEPLGSPSQVYANNTDFTDLAIEEFQFAKVKVTDDTSMEGVREELIQMGSKKDIRSPTNEREA